MPAEPPALVRNFPVGRRVCTLTIPRPKLHGVVTMVAEWAPDMPKRLNRREWRQYRKGRDKTLAELSRDLGIKTLVVEI